MSSESITHLTRICEILLHIQQLSLWRERCGEIAERRVSSRENYYINGVGKSIGDTKGRIHT